MSIQRSTKRPLPKPLLFKRVLFKRALCCGAALAALLCVAFVASPSASARCARALWVPTLLTPTDQPLPTQATLLVGLNLEWDRRREALAGRFPDDAALVPRTEEGEEGAARIPLRVVELGAGLARYEPTARPAEGVYEMVGLGQPREITFASRGGLRVAAPRPPSRVELNVGPMRVRGRRGATTTTRAVRATLPAAADGPPSALIGYWEGEAGAAAMLTNGATEVILYRESIPCASPLPGTRMPLAGERRELALVNAFGRVSRRVRR